MLRYASTSTQYQFLLQRYSGHYMYCKKCGASIEYGKSKHKDGVFEPVIGRPGEQSDATCWYCPWSSSLNVSVKLDALDAICRNIAMLWARAYGHEPQTMGERWTSPKVSGKKVNVRTWRRCARALLGLGILRKDNRGQIAMPPAYVVEAGKSPLPVPATVVTA